MKKERKKNNFLLVCVGLQTILSLMLGNDSYAKSIFDNYSPEWWNPSLLFLFRNASVHSKLYAHLSFWCNRMRPSPKLASHNCWWRTYVPSSGWYCANTQPKIQYVHQNTISINLFPFFLTFLHFSQTEWLFRSILCIYVCAHTYVCVLTTAKIPFS